MKDWILQYADNEDSAEESEETVNGDHTTGPLTFDLVGRSLPALVSSSHGHICNLHSHRTSVDMF